MSSRDKCYIQTDDLKRLLSRLEEFLSSAIDAATPLVAEGHPGFLIGEKQLIDRDKRDRRLCRKVLRKLREATK